MFTKNGTNCTVVTFKSIKFQIISIVVVNVDNQNSFFFYYSRIDFQGMSNKNVVCVLYLVVVKFTFKNNFIGYKITI